MDIQIKRIYEPYSINDGCRILIDRLWPRGIKKENAHIDQWLKEVAPSTLLRKWYNHDPQKLDQFRLKYHEELKVSDALKELLDCIKDRQIVTLLYASREEKLNHAIILRDFINNS